jgi:hypothetical protein
MPFTAATAYPSLTAGDVANSRALVATAPSADTTVKADFSTSTTRRKIQWKATGTQPNTATDSRAAGGPAAGFGWHVPKAEMNRIANLPARALIPAGVWNFNVAFTTAQADATGAAAVIEAWVYRRKADGTYTFLFTATSTGVAVTLAGAKTATMASATQPALVLETDETVHVEYLVHAQGVAITGNIYTLDLGSATNVAFPAAVAANYPRTLSFSATGSASTGPRAVATRKTVTVVATPTYGRLITAARSRSVTAAATAAMAKFSTMARSFVVTATGTARVRLDIPEAALDRIVVGGPVDTGAGTGKTIGGVVRNADGDPVAGAVVALVRESDAFEVAETTSAADGTYSFDRAAADAATYYVVGHKPEDAELHGTSRRELVPV